MIADGSIACQTRLSLVGRFDLSPATTDDPPLETEAQLDAEKISGERAAGNDADKNDVPIGKCC